MPSVIAPRLEAGVAVSRKASVTKKWHRAGMNAMTPIPGTRAQLSHDDQVCLWRGRYVEEFAMAEAAVSEALAKLSALASSGGKSLLPHAVGQRIESLRAIAGVAGPLAGVGGRVVRALDDLREHQRRRNFLCHGFSEVSVDGSGNWHLTISLTSFRAGAIERSFMHIAANEAVHLLDGLRSARVRLDGQLRGMLASLIR